MDILGKDNAIVNIYQMSDDANGFLLKSFDEDLIEWIDFVRKSRRQTIEI